MKITFHHYLVACSLVFISFSTCPLQKIDSTSYWTYCDKNTFKFLTLKSSGEYYYLFSSCKGESIHQGTYSYIGDSLNLKESNQNKIELFLFKENRLLPFIESKDAFSSSEPLEKTHIKSSDLARKKCGHEWFRKRRRGIKPRSK